MSALLKAYEASIIVGKKGNRFDVEVPEGELQSAWATDVEKTYTKFAAQFVTYAQAVEHELDPVWRFVTGYYAALFSAVSLLAMTGRLRRRFGPGLPIAEGLWSVTTVPLTNTGSPILRVRGERGGSMGSHRASWDELASLFAVLSGVAGNDSYTGAVLQSLADMVKGPDHVSAFRNALTYGLDEGPWSRPSWRCLLRDLQTPADVEDAAYSGTPKDEQRVEILMLACGSLVRTLFDDYGRRVRVDTRPRQWRTEYFRRIAGTPFAGCAAVVHG